MNYVKFIFPDGQEVVILAHKLKDVEVKHQLGKKYKIEETCNNGLIMTKKKDLRFIKKTLYLH